MVLGDSKAHSYFFVGTHNRYTHTHVYTHTLTDILQAYRFVNLRGKKRGGNLVTPLVAHALHLMNSLAHFLSSYLRDSSVNKTKEQRPMAFPTSLLK